MVWEDKDKWLERMSKVLCTYAVMTIQPEQTPLSTADAWAWVSNMVNYCAKVSNPPFYAAPALDIFLRVVSVELLKAYGSLFMEVLELIRSKILGKLADDQRKKILVEFLDRFLNSKGSDSMSLFVET